ncbi:MAG: hypothetical protein F6K11_34755 [Leptolyngbya sp. SIO3F4]|nr:hypothetical protein [Leptolyngbya sp. SIO3F4]
MAYWSLIMGLDKKAWTSVEKITSKVLAAKKPAIKSSIFDVFAADFEVAEFMEQLT